MIRDQIDFILKSQSGLVNRDIRLCHYHANGNNGVLICFTLSCVREVSMTLPRSDVDPASATLPREEEEPRVTSYAAAEVEDALGCRVERQKAKPALLLTSSGGGRVLSMCRCFGANAL